MAGNNGTYGSSGITYVGTGPLSGGRSITSNGSYAAITASDAELPMGSSARTIEFWVKTTSTTYNKDFWGYGTYSTPNALALNFNSATVLGWNIYGTSGTFPTLSSAINGGTWHHIAVTYSAGASIAALYVDGVSIGNSISQTVPNITSDGTGLFIGSGLDGKIAASFAHFAIYPTVLSSGIISSHYSAASESAYEALVLASAPSVYYKMQETSGTVATDSSGSIPTITSLSAYSGTPGTNITLTGTGFNGTTSVLVGSTSASFTINSNTSLTVTIPSVSLGTYNISVINGYGTGIYYGGFDNYVNALSPLRFYKLSESSGTTMVDSSGNYNGTYPGSGVTYGVTGPITGVGNTDTAITVTVAVTSPQTGLPSGYSTRTLGFWYKTSNSVSGYEGVLGYGTGTTQEYWNFFFNNNPTTFGIDRDGSALLSFTVPQLNNNIWHFIVGTFDSSKNGNLYIDGNFIGSANDNSLNTVLGSVLGFGSWGTQSYAEIFILNSALTSTQVSTLYNLTSQAVTAFTVTNSPPTVTGISPSTGPNGGGTSVVITGTSFSGVSGVSFGSNAASSYVVNSTTQITAVTPAGTSTVHTIVTTGSGTSSTSSADQFTYYPPSVTGISPSTGPNGQVVIVSGQFFTSGMTVKFGATNASSQSFNSSAQFTATAPSGMGTVDITVGGSATLSADQFTYSNIPSISSVSPNVGPNAGGTSVLITGSKFTGVVSVYFGSTSAASYIFNSDTSITAVSPAGTTGTVDITVTNATGTNHTSSLDYFTYYPPPTVTGLSLSYGISGTVIVITGTQFTGMSGVKFGSASVTSPTLNSSIQITATAPTNSAGTYDITITTPGGISAISSADQFTYVTTPTVTGLSPTNGTTGTSITLTGTAFQGITSVKINSVSASFTVNSTTSITVTAPTNSTGTYHTTVTNASGTSTTSPTDQFTYVPVPTITSISPTYGGTGGGTVVVITGTQFTLATGVTFAGASASFTVNSSTTITTTSPIGSAGVADILVISPGGSSNIVAGDKFTYYSPPVVTSVSPIQILGGTTITITGTGYSAVSSVYFGAIPATSYIVHSLTDITAIAPSLSLGTFDIIVTTLGGPSSTSSADQVTYANFPEISIVSPNLGPLIGGDVITISGDNFNGVKAVYFGSWAATSFTLINDNQLTAITPVVSSAATVNITIVTPIGTSPTTDTDLFSFTSGTGVAPAGTITFFADNGSGPIQIGEPSPITAHSANVSDYSLAVGTYSITAQYNGDGNHYGTGLSTPATLIVNKASTTISLPEPAFNPGLIGMDDTVTVSVNSNPMGPFIPTGTVTFYDGGIALSPTKSLINGQTTFTAIWSSGNHSITASYGGDSNFNSCGPSQALNLSIGNYLVSSWLTPINGFTPEATNYSNEIRQFLGTHFDIPIYDGLPLNPNPILDLGTIDQLVRTFPGLNGIIVDQPFVAPAAELDRIELQLFALNGQGSDVLVQIFADSSGVPTGSPLVSVTVPREAILGVTSPNIPVLTEPTSLMSTSSVNSNGRLDTLASLYDITTSLWSSDNTPPNLNPLPPADSSSTPIWFFGSCSTGQAIVEAGGYIGAATGSTNTGLIGAGGISVWQNWGDLPTPLFYNSLAYTGGQVLCVGGCTDSDNSTSSTFTTTLNDTGALGSWSTGPTLPQALGMCGVAASQSIPGYGAAVYVIGGVVNGSSDVVSQNCVYMTQYNNSSLSEFTDVPVNYFPYGVRGAGACCFGSPLPTLPTPWQITQWIVVVGGAKVSGPTNQVWSAGILADNTLNPWQALPNIPESRFLWSVVSVPGGIIAYGGTSDGTTFLPGGYSLSIDINGIPSSRGWVPIGGSFTWPGGQCLLASNDSPVALVSLPNGSCIQTEMGRVSVPLSLSGLTPTATYHLQLSSPNANPSDCTSVRLTALGNCKIGTETVNNALGIWLYAGIEGDIRHMVEDSVQAKYESIYYDGRNLPIVFSDEIGERIGSFYILEYQHGHLVQML